MTTPFDHEVYFDFHDLIAHVIKALPVAGGVVTVEGIADRVAPQWAPFGSIESRKARENLVRRALEWSQMLTTTADIRIPAFIGIDRRSGRVLTPQRPRKIRAVENAIIVEPTG